MSAPTIYIVDDDAGVQGALRRLLGAGGYPVADFPSAEEFLRASGPDARGCLVLDLSLPGMSGLELQELLSTQKWHLSVIFFTSRFEEPMQDAAVRRGAVAFLRKPSELGQLQAHVKAVMEVSAPPTVRDPRAGGPPRGNP